MQPVSLGPVAPVDARQRRAKLRQQPQQTRLVGLRPRPCRQGGAFVPGLEPLGQTPPSDEGGERFVEGHVAGDPHLAVGELVEQQRRQIGFRPGDEGTEQRILEPSQGGVGRDRADVGLQPQPGQGLRPAPGVGLVEETPVGRAADHRVAPAVRLQGQRRRGEHVPHHGGAVQSHVGAIAAVGGQRQPAVRELEQRLAVGEPFVQAGRFRVVVTAWRQVLEHPFHRLPGLQHPPLPQRRVGVVGDGLTAGDGRQQHQGGEARPPTTARGGRMHVRMIGAGVEIGQ